MTYLLIKEKGKKRYRLECPEIYGIETWGNTCQTTLEKKRKYWYINYWSAEDDYIDEVNGWELDTEIPVFTQDRNYIERWVYVKEDCIE